METGSGIVWVNELQPSGTNIDFLLSQFAANNGTISIVDEDGDSIAFTPDTVTSTASGGQDAYKFGSIDYTSILVEGIATICFTPWKTR